MTKKFKVQSTILILFFSANPFTLAQNISFLRTKDISLTALPYGRGSLTYYSFASGDFNGDGKLDFVSSTSSIVNMQTMYSATFSTVLLLGNGDGTFKTIDLSFTPKTALLNGIQQEFVLAVDVNGDKKLDLIISIGPQVNLFLGNGDGTFQPSRPLPAIPLAFADFNGDGKPDLLAAGQFVDGQRCSENSLSVYPGNGDGTFRDSLPCSNPFGEGDWATRVIVIGDLNGDGKLDVLWVNSRSSSVILSWLGNGDGTFQTPNVVSRPGNSTRPIALGDLNHDGKPDLVVGTQHGVYVLLGNGDGTFQAVAAVAGPHYLQWFDGVDLGGSRDWNVSSDIFIRDFDGDGNQDILQDDVLFRGKGDGTFQPPQYLGAGSSDGFSSAISVICDDLNGDGKSDIVYLPRVTAVQPGASGKLSILLNNSPNVIASNVLGYSAATGGSLLAPATIASIYGKNLAKVTTSALSSALSTQLGGISLRVRDSSDTVRLALLILVSPTQINFVMPPETSIGPATLHIDDGSTQLQEGANATIVNTLGPGFFTLNQNGAGVPAATAVRIRSDKIQEPVPVFNCGSAGQCSALPIDLTSGLPVYLSLYGTGFGYEFNKGSVRGAKAVAFCQIGGKDATIQFVGPHPLYPGLDQLNLLIPQSLPSGQAIVECNFLGMYQGSGSSNVVSIAIK